MGDSDSPKGKTLPTRVALPEEQKRLREEVNARNTAIQEGVAHTGSMTFGGKGTEPKKPKR